MAVFVLSLVILFAITGFSDASYCVCNDGLSSDVYQKNIDYACGAGADCTPITQNGPCYNPNTAKDHCNYAVNSYYQKKGQTPMSCSFLNTATVTQSPPSSSTSGCVYPSSPSNTTTPTTPSTGGTPPTMGGTPAGGTPSPPTMGGTPAGGTPSPPTMGGGTPIGGTPPTMGGTPTGGTPNTGGTPSTMVPGTTTGSPPFGLGPTGSGFTNTESGATSVTLVRSTTLYMSLSLTLFICGLMSLRA